MLMVIAPSPADLVHVRLVGDWDRATNAPLAALLRRAVRPGVRGLVVDMSGTTFVDCSTLHVLEREALRFSARGGRLVVARPSTLTSRVLDLTGFARTWPVTEDLGRALEVALADPADPR
ncbi:MAG: STAS domain-containing protein [Nocardioidaceae bacterium]|nr:STAS domain-containing protein [Nocardioidaceae bacterium]